MNKIPERIYLQVFCDGEACSEDELPVDNEYIYWSETKKYNDDIEYVLASKYEELEKRIADLRIAIKDILDNIPNMKTFAMAFRELSGEEEHDVKALEEALQFYANEDNYYTESVHGSRKITIESDAGNMARDTLEGTHNNG